MDKFTVFNISLIVAGIVFALLVLFIGSMMNKDNTQKIEKLPRNVVFGTIIAIIDIAWCAPQAVAVFSPSSTVIVWSVGVIALIVGCIFLDYLFARALAGFLILLAHYFLKSSFAVDLPFISLFSILCLIFGSAGIVFGGIPHLFRDYLRKLCNNKIWKTISLLYFALSAVVMFGAGLFLILGR